MTILARSIVNTTGFIGAPGVNVIHWVSAVGTLGSYDSSLVQDWHDKLSACLYSNAGNLVTGVTSTIDPTVILFDETTGVAEGSVTQDGTSDDVHGGDADNTSSRSNCLTIRHYTNRWVAGRSLSGRTFIGPCGGGIFDATGQIASNVISATPINWLQLCEGLDGNLVVWHRPTTKNGTDGAYGPVVRSACNSMPGSLRSRKS